MDSSQLEGITSRLKGLKWFVISGGAVEIYTHGLRKSRDLDLALQGSDINIFAERIGTKASKRVIDKGTFFVEDYGFETTFGTLPIEATNGYPRKRVSEKTFDKLFKRRTRHRYLGSIMYVEPLEELMVQKAFMKREKDVQDLLLLSTLPFDKGKIHEYASDWGEEKSVILTLRGLGYLV